MADTLFTELYQAFYTVVGWVGGVWSLLTSPMHTWVNFDFSDIPLLDALLGWIDEALDALLQGYLGDLSLLSFVFGSGFSLIMVITLARFFFK